MKHEFPKWVYFRDGRKALVHGPEELEALPQGWAESPAAFHAAIEVIEPPYTVMDAPEQIQRLDESDAEALLRVNRMLAELGEDAAADTAAKKEKAKATKTKGGAK